MPAPAVVVDDGVGLVVVVEPIGTKFDEEDHGQMIDVDVDAGRVHVHVVDGLASMRSRRRSLLLRLYAGYLLPRLNRARYVP